MNEKANTRGARLQSSRTKTSRFHPQSTRAASLAAEQPPSRTSLQNLAPKTRKNRKHKTNTKKKPKTKQERTTHPGRPNARSWDFDYGAKKLAASVLASDSVLREMRVFMPVCAGTKMRRTGLDQNKICPIDVDRRDAWKDSWIPHNGLRK
jgi:hypothetical protein